MVMYTVVFNTGQFFGSHFNDFIRTLRDVIRRGWDLTAVHTHLSYLI